jgi:hypothetical protein
MDNDGLDGLEAMSESLWQMRQLLGRLVFKLAIVNTLLSAEAYDWLPIATDEVAALVDELNVLDRDLGTLRGLRTLAARTPEPWTTILGDHYLSLVRLRRQLRQMARGTQGALAAGAGPMVARVAALEAEHDELGGQLVRMAWTGAERTASLTQLAWDVDDLS